MHMTGQCCPQAWPHKRRYRTDRRHGLKRAGSGDTLFALTLRGRGQRAKAAPLTYEVCSTSTKHTAASSAAGVRGASGDGGRSQTEPKSTLFCTLSPCSGSLFRVHFRPCPLAYVSSHGMRNLLNFSPSAVLNSLGLPALRHSFSSGRPM